MARSREMSQMCGSIGGNLKNANLTYEQRIEATAPARAAGPGNLEWHMKQVDPNGEMSDGDRLKCAQNHKKAYYARMALASAKSRRKAPAKRAQPDVAGQ